MRRTKDYKEYQKDSGPVEIRHPLIVARYFPQNRTPSEEYDLHDWPTASRQVILQMFESSYDFPSFHYVSCAKVIKKLFPPSFSSRFNNLRKHRKTDTSLYRIRFYKKKEVEYTFFSYFCTKFPRIMNSEPTYNLLNSINYPEDLRKLTVDRKSVV